MVVEVYLQHFLYTVRKQICTKANWSKLCTNCTQKETKNKPKEKHAFVVVWLLLCVYGNVLCITFNDRTLCIWTEMKFLQSLPARTDIIYLEGCFLSPVPHYLKSCSVLFSQVQIHLRLWQRRIAVRLRPRTLSPPSSRQADTPHWTRFPRRLLLYRASGVAHHPPQPSQV